MDDKSMKVLSIILNEKKTEYIKEIDKLKLKEKKLTILNNKLSTYYQELFMTFTTLSSVMNRHIINENVDEEDEDLEEFITRNNHLLNVIDYDKEYISGFMDCLKSVIISYTKYLTTDNHLQYGDVRQMIANEINPDESDSD
jgi:hypothetical protein|tara:strand:- start:2844 stop:3269 length:426 start_codon:yes stop_codon:yes gene_type:complete